MFNGQRFRPHRDSSMSPPTRSILPSFRFLISQNFPSISLLILVLLLLLLLLLLLMLLLFVATLLPPFLLLCIVWLEIDLVLIGNLIIVSTSLEGPRVLRLRQSFQTQFRKWATWQPVKSKRGGSHHLLIPSFLSLAPPPPPPPPPPPLAPPSALINPSLNINNNTNFCF